MINIWKTEKVKIVCRDHNFLRDHAKNNFQQKKMEKGQKGTWVNFY